jgi:hypothetical protein
MGIPCEHIAHCDLVHVSSDVVVLCVLVAAGKGFSARYKKWMIVVVVNGEMVRAIADVADTTAINP